MPWDVDLHTDFVREFDALPEAVQDELLAHVAVLEVFGPQPRASARGHAQGLASQEHEGIAL